MAMSKNLSGFQHRGRTVGNNYADRRQREEEKVLQQRTQGAARKRRVAHEEAHAKAQSTQKSKFKKSHLSVNGTPHRPSVVDNLHNGNKSQGIPDDALLNFLGKVIDSTPNARRFAKNAKAAMRKPGARPVAKRTATPKARTMAEAAARAKTHA